MITHLCFSGSHIWGICYVGIIRYIYTYPDKFKIRDVGGTSFGAVIAVSFALNLDMKTIEKMFYELANSDELKNTAFENILNIPDEMGMESTYKYTLLIRKHIKQFYGADDLTFLELSKKTGINLHVNALCVNTSEEILFNVDNTPDVFILDAVQASIAIPFISIPMKINKQLFCDPGFIHNTIVDYFDDIPQEQILSVINKPIDIKTNYTEEEMNSSIYLSTVFGILCRKIKYGASLQYINDNTLILNNHHNIVGISLTENSILFNIDDKSIDNAIMHGFKLTQEWMNKRK